MANLGPNDLKQFALPSYWDAATLTQYQLADGTTYDQWIADVSAALSMANGELTTDPLYAGLISLTTDLAMEYPVGVSNGFALATEYGLPDQKRGATTGHMLPLDPYDRGMGWTWMFLQKARRAQLDADVGSVVQDLRDIWQKTILQRLFKSTYTAIGSAGRSMPLADGGTADSTYVPVPAPNRGGTFLYTHDHVSEYNGIVQAAVETAVGNLWEHGYDAPYDMLIAQADIGSWTTVANVTGWVQRPDGTIRYGTSTDLAQLDASYVGAIETKYGACRVRATGRIPTAFWAVYKSYGPLDQRNPLKVRYNPKYGIGATLLKGDHIREYPLENAIMWTEFGVGVGNRVGAVVMKNSAGAYSDPTIS